MNEVICVIICLLIIYKQSYVRHHMNTFICVIICLLSYACNNICVSYTGNNMYAFICMIICLSIIYAESYVDNHMLVVICVYHIKETICGHSYV